MNTRDVNLIFKNHMVLGAMTQIISIPHPAAPSRCLGQTHMCGQLVTRWLILGHRHTEQCLQ